MPRDLSAYVDDVLDDVIAASTEPEREFSLEDVRNIINDRYGLHLTAAAAEAIRNALKGMRKRRNITPQDGLSTTWKPGAPPDFRSDTISRH